jgi:hypothetical protein
MTHHGPFELSAAEEDGEVEAEGREDLPGDDAAEDEGEGGEDVWTGVSCMC